MAKKVKSYRLEPDLIERIAAYSKSRGWSEGQFVEAASEAFLDDARGGVPDLAPPMIPAQQISADLDEWKRTMGERQDRLNKAKAR